MSLERKTGIHGSLYSTIILYVLSLWTAIGMHYLANHVNHQEVDSFYDIIALLSAAFKTALCLFCLLIIRMLFSSVKKFNDAANTRYIFAQIVAATMFFGFMVIEFIIYRISARYEIDKYNAIDARDTPRFAQAVNLTKELHGFQMINIFVYFYSIPLDHRIHILYAFALNLIYVAYRMVFFESISVHLYLSVILIPSLFGTIGIVRVADKNRRVSFLMQRLMMILKKPQSHGVLEVSPIKTSTRNQADALA